MANIKHKDLFFSQYGENKIFFTKVFAFFSDK
jgi:hypothetical protein